METFEKTIFTSILPGRWIKARARFEKFPDRDQKIWLEELRDYQDQIDDKRRKNGNKNLANKTV